MNSPGYPRIWEIILRTSQSSSEKCRVRRAAPSASGWTHWTAAYAAEQTVNGYHRPYGGPQQWMSQPFIDGKLEWLQLEWEQEQTLAEIHLTFNDEVDEDLVNLHHHTTPFAVIPELVRNYSLAVRTADGEWRELASVQNNRKRKMVHHLPQPIRAQALKLFIESTNGSRYAEVVEMRAYGHGELHRRES